MSARGVFDVRLFVEAETEQEAWAQAYRLLNRARLIAPEGVDVRYVQLRPATRSRVFAATMSPRPREGAA